MNQVTCFVWTLFLFLILWGDKFVLIFAGLVGAAFSHSFATWANDPYVIALAKLGQSKQLKNALKSRGVATEELNDAAKLLVAEYAGI